MKLAVFNRDDENTEERFGFKVFQCIDRALSTIGEYEKGQTLTTLERWFGLSGRDLASHPQKLEEYLKEILGVSEAAFVIIHIRENIATEFNFKMSEQTPISEAIDLARSRVTMPLPVTSQAKQKG